MSEYSYTLLMQLGPHQGDTVPVQGDEFVMGRDPACSWSIEDIEVSRRHARLVLDKGVYSIEDLGSTNGTFVNGQRIRTLLPLLPGATIRLGENVLLFYDVPSAEGESATKTVNVEVEAPAPAPEPNASLAEEVEPQKPLVTAELVPPEDPQHVEPFVETDAEPPAAPQAVKRRSRSKSGINFSDSVSVLGSQISMGMIAIVAIGVLALIAFLWYVDANLLWCDVFGNLIAACR